MSSITVPHGLERPARTISRRDRPLPLTVRPCDPDLLRRAEQPNVPVSHVALWCVAGSIGWAAALGAGWLMMNVVDRLL